MSLQVNPLRTVKTFVADGRFGDALAELGKIAAPGQDFPTLQRTAKILDGIDLASLGLKPVRVALVATSTIDYLVPLLRLWLALDGFAADVFLAEYDTMTQTVLDPESALYQFRPDVVWLFTGHRDVRTAVSAGSSAAEVEEAVESEVGLLRSLWDAIARTSPAAVIQNNADLPLARVFGNLDGVAPWGRTAVLRRFNLRLADSAATGVTVFDLDHLAAEFGRARWQDERYWFHGKTPFSLDALGIVAFQGARLIASIKGQAKKCLVLDLDNTLWGGVIGDDGVEGIRLGNGASGEAFLAFQDYVLSLKRRGVILAVCSKNDAATARLPFDDHPDMRLRLDDIAVFVANWDNKAVNISGIAETLDIGLDSLVFIDDNPAERELVRRLLPMVTVPELPEDPALYVRAIDSLRLFETVTFSEEDRGRGDMYRENAQRKELRATFSDLGDYLRDLEMVAEVGPFDAISIPRAAQLLNKSNQFHLTTTRYTEAEIRALGESPRHVCRWFQLKDRLGNNGLIAVLIAERRDDDLIIDTWAMSCRVLSRTMEEFIVNTLVGLAREAGAARLVGRYIPTRKNKMVEDLYPRLGFSLLSGIGDTTEWGLDITSDLPDRPCYVTVFTSRHEDPDR
jgi:FkbH-like protein